MRIIDATFTPPLAKYGFRVASRIQSGPPSYGDAISYLSGHRRVTVGYAHTREQQCEILISGYGEPEPISDLMSFAGGIPQNAQYISTNIPERFKAEADRCCGLLLERCDEFLRGDIAAFRLRYRELFLVEQVRAARYNAWAAGKWEDFERYYGWLADYWSQQDLEAAESSRRIRKELGE